MGAYGSRYTISKTDTLIGVYNINKGYADFRQISILYQNDEYSIVKSNTTYGLNVFDYIVLDASTVDQNSSKETTEESTSVTSQASSEESEEPVADETTEEITEESSEETSEEISEENSDTEVTNEENSENNG